MEADSLNCCVLAKMSPRINRSLRCLFVKLCVDDHKSWAKMYGNPADYCAAGLVNAVSDALVARLQKVVVGVLRRKA